MGIADGWSENAQDGFACYDYDACIRILVERDKMDWEGAVEYFEFNVIGAYVGRYTPIFVHNWRQELDGSDP